MRRRRTTESLREALNAANNVTDGGGLDVIANAGGTFTSGGADAITFGPAVLATPTRR